MTENGCAATTGDFPPRRWPPTMPRMLPRGQIFYDASCGLCTRAYQRFGPATERRGFKWIPLQEPRARALLNLEGDEMPDEVKLLTIPKGQMLGGADAVLHIARRLWWAWPIWLVSHVPLVRPAMRVGYRWVAKHRHELSSACGVEARPQQAAVDRAA